MRISDWSSDVCSSDLLRLGADAHEATVGRVGPAGGDALGDDARARVLAEVDHLGAGVGLLIVVGDGDGVELAHRVVALQDARSEERRVGKECVSTCRSRWSPYH